MTTLERRISAIFTRLQLPMPGSDSDPNKNYYGPPLDIEQKMGVLALTLSQIFHRDSILPLDININRRKVENFPQIIDSINLHIDRADAILITRSPTIH